jgi:HlyD family secretion protein
MSSSGTKSSSALPAASAAKRRPPIALILILLAALIFILWRLFAPQENPHQLFASGRLEGYETNLSPKIGGRIDWIKYREGAIVQKNELVAKLSDADYQAQLRGAEARISKSMQAVKQQMDQLSVVGAQIAGATKRYMQSRAETSAAIDQGTANLKQAQARYAQAQADTAQSRSDLSLAAVRLQRYTNLVKKGAVTKDEYDQACTTYKNDLDVVASKESNEAAACRAVQAAQAALDSNLAQKMTPPQRFSDLNVFQSQRDAAEKQIKQAQDDVKNAIADRDQIQANLDYLNIRSPIYGVVTARPVEPGAVLAPGQTILTVIDYNQVYMRAYIPEGSIGKVRVGQEADVYLDAMPKRAFAGKVIEIDPEATFTPENIYFKNDRVKQVFGIKIGIDKPEGFAKPGMPADVYIKI